MRLVCPNCDAEYEVDDAAIPKGGRDVQCSNCGHAWFQVHPEVEAAQEAEADLYEAPAGAIATNPQPAPVPAAAPVSRIPTAPLADGPPPSPPEAATEEESAEDAAAPAQAPQQRTLDETVLAVLREEAEREAKARRAETAAQPVIETQTEMPLANDPGGLASAVRRIARLRSGDEPEPAPMPPPAPKTRGQMLPAIEEINSTLRATSERTGDEDSAVLGAMEDAAPRSGGFRRGFTTLVVVAVVIVVLYLLAPVIAAKVPALAGVAAAYVAAVDVARVWLDVHLRALISTLRGFAGGQGG